MILQGDALETLRTLPDNHVDMSICSPPYWQLRRYLPDDSPDKPLEIGTESSYDEYVTRLCDVFDEVKRVLRPDGTLWVNINDCFSTGGGVRTSHKMRNRRGITTTGTSIRLPSAGIPKKSLCLIPYRFAIEMVNRGWLVRNVLIWRKPSVAPESMKDRFTIDYELIFFFSKSKHYYFEQQFEPTVDAATRKRGQLWRNMRSVWTIPPDTTPYKNHSATYPEALVEVPIRAACPPGGIVLDPFSGVATTGCVAKRLGRQYIGIELNPEYVESGNRRLAAVTHQS